MKTTGSIIIAAAALASAQVTFNNATGEWTCSRPNQAYCAGGSSSTDIIIRCDAQGKGQPGRCTNNLAGQPPIGVNPALCYQTNGNAGDAACQKNCVVYGQSTFTLPASVCTPYFTSATGSVTGSRTLTTPVTSVPSTARPLSTGGSGVSSGRPNNSTVIGGPSIRPSTPIGVSSVRPSTAPAPVGTGTGTRPGGTNGTTPGQPGTPGTPGQPGQSATNVPSAPSGSRIPTVPTAGAVKNSVGYLAIVGLVTAYFV